MAPDGTDGAGRAIVRLTVHNARVMATPKPGEIRCPTCHRSTPPAAFCTQCGSVIPPDARIRPRGMDRDELQDRIRARRSGDDPYFRGSDVDEGTGIYERFEPDPTDRLARRDAPAAEPRTDLLGAGPAAPSPPPQRTDLTRDREEWIAPAGSGAAIPPPLVDPAPPAAPPAATPPGAYDDGSYGGNDDYDYGYDDYDWQETRRSGGGGILAILGFLGLGALALVAGAVLANALGNGIGQGDATPTPIASVAPSVAATPQVTAAPSPSLVVPSESAAPSGGPIVFPDGFTAATQPCIPGSVRADGCDSNGAANSGSVEIWVGFRKGTASDVIGAILEHPDGTTEDASIDLADINCGSICNGYTWFQFSNLEPGTYEVRITRNGELAAVTTFEVS